MRRFRFTFAAFGAFLLAFGNDHSQPAPGGRLNTRTQPAAAPIGATAAPATVRYSLPSDAVAVALLALQRVPASHWPFVRWVWCRRGLPEDMKAVIFGLNSVSRSPTLFNPAIDRILIQVDLRDMVATEKQLDELIEVWEQLVFDPSFSLLITGDTINLLSEDQKNNTTIIRRWKEFPEDGSAPILRTSSKKVAAMKFPIIVERATPAHLARSGIEKLQAATHTFAPIVSDNYLIGRMLSTIKDRTKVKRNGKDVEKDNLFSIVYGGLYYEFSGIKKSPKEGVSDLENYFSTLGLAGRGLTFQQFFDRLRSEQRAALERSEVTGKPRRIVWVGTPNTRQTEARGALFFTIDVQDRDVDSSGHAVLNLEDGLVPRAYEVIAVKPNGMHEYSLFNGKGELLELAAQDVVADRTVQHPYTPKLQASISCHRCHGPHRGIIPFENDILALRKEIDIFGAFNRVNKVDRIRKLQGLYTGSIGPLLAEVRRQYSGSTLRVTGNWRVPLAAKDQSNVVELSTDQVGKTFARDRYDMVSVEDALAEIGQIVPRDAAGGFDHDTTTARAKKLFAAPVASPGVFVFDDVRLAYLRLGRPILRNDWNLIYSFAMARASANAG